MRVALCQLNSVVGDLDGNASRILTWYRDAVGRGAGLVVFPELALTGYPPRDLLDLPDFRARIEEVNRRVAAETGEAGLVFGTALSNPSSRGKPLHNGALVCARGAIQGRLAKKLLPVYDVFDEARHFEPDLEPARPIAFGGIRWGFHICEDAWNEEGFWPRRLYVRDPVAELADNGSQILVNLSASPFHARKISFRESMFRSHCRSLDLPLLYTNAVGGNDELVFDGASYVMDAEGTLASSGRPFVEEALLVDVVEANPARVSPEILWSPGVEGTERPASVYPQLDLYESIELALVLGLRDYASKCGFKSAVLGLSGGIDSAVTAVLAVRALGPENVWGVSLPSRYSSPGSGADAESLARALGIRYETLSIEPMFEATLKTMAGLFARTFPGPAEENLQARARGMILMALSNKFGHLLLSTGNKSELAVGYCTLYGDMAGGLAVISDVPKTMVYALGRHLNRDRVLIPENTFTKPPSAELRPDQTDQDSLPPYDVLDRILEGYIEECRSEAELADEGLPPETVRRVIGMVSRAEYKRRQAAPGIKISPKAFGTGRRMPIATTWPPAPRS